LSGDAGRKSRRDHRLKGLDSAWDWSLERLVTRNLGGDSDRLLGRTATPAIRRNRP